MSAGISLRIATLDGQEREIVANSFDTVRSILGYTDLPQHIDNRHVFVSNGHVLSPDFTLSHHNIKDGSCITIIDVNKQRDRHNRTELMRRRFDQLDRLNQEALLERMRVADLSYIHHNTSKSGHKVICHLHHRMEAQSQQYDASLHPRFITQITDTKPTKISDSPLPISAKLFDTDAL